MTWNRLVSSEVEGDPGGRTLADLIRAKAQGVFGFDERSLAVYWIGLGLLLIADLVTRLDTLA